MSNFTDLDLEHKKTLLATLFIQNELIEALSEISKISRQSLIFSVRTSVYAQVEQLSHKDIDEYLEKIETMLQQGFV